MLELFQEAIAWYNLPITVLFILINMYWAFVCIGALDLETFELDLDFDVDAEADADIDVEGATHGVFLGFLKFVNIGEVPLMIILTIMITVTWVLSIVTNYYLNPNAVLLIGLGFLAANFFVSVFLTKFLSEPFRYLMKNLNQTYEEHQSIIGRICKIKTGEVTDRFGQAEVDTEGASLLLNVRLFKSSEPLLRGDLAMVIDHEEGSGIYYVKKVNEDEI